MIIPPSESFVDKGAPKVAFHTLGCRLNLAETGSIAEQFQKRGFEIVTFGEEADVTFLNTCTVTDQADSTCRNLIRKARKFSPESKIVVAGCYAQMEAEKITKMNEVDLVLGTQDKFRVFDFLEAEEKVEMSIEKSTEFWGASTTLSDNHTRAFLKIQDGCNYICSFCIIPFARGRSRTISVKDAISEAQKLVSQGYKEIVLTGVNIGEYESSSGESLVDLVSRLSEISGLERLRLGSVEPNTINEKLLIALKAGGKYQDHFHIPLQSGSNEILRLMKRKYNRQQYLDILDMVKSYFPKSSIGADMIVGFPGETSQDFEETFALAQTSALTHFHVFPYSKRKNTVAAKLPDQINSLVKKERVSLLIELGEKKLADFANNLLGEKVKVLFEDHKNGFWSGHGSHFIKIKVPFIGKDHISLDNNLKNTIREVVITHKFDTQGKFLIGEFN